MAGEDLLEEMIEIFRVTPYNKSAGQWWTSNAGLVPTTSGLNSASGAHSTIDIATVTAKEWQAAQEAAAAANATRGTTNLPSTAEGLLELSPSNTRNFRGTLSEFFERGSITGGKFANVADDVGDVLGKINPGIAEMGSGVLDIIAGIPGFMDQLSNSFLGGIEEIGGFPKGFFKSDPEARITASTRSLDPEPVRPSKNINHGSLAQKLRVPPPSSAQPQRPPIRRGGPTIY
jgi:hypothetical protein